MFCIVVRVESGGQPYQMRCSCLEMQAAAGYQLRLLQSCQTANVAAQFLSNKIFDMLTGDWKA